MLKFNWVAVCKEDVSLRDEAVVDGWKRGNLGVRKLVYLMFASRKDQGIENGGNDVKK